MYCPVKFAENRLPILHELMRSHSLGMWTCWVDNQLVVNHIPFVLDETAGEFGTLHGHVAKANPIWELINNDAVAVVVFQGPQSYITPSWYPSKLEHGKVVPTWNYAVVHAHGKPKVIRDKQWILNHVSTLSDEQEAGRKNPWKVSDAPEDFTNKLANGIVGISIPIKTLDGRWKVSQNKTSADAMGVVAGLNENSAGFESAELVRKRMK